VGPKEPCSTVLSKEEEALIVAFRKSSASRICWPPICRCHGRSSVRCSGKTCRIPFPDIAIEFPVLAEKFPVKEFKIPCCFQ